FNHSLSTSLNNSRNSLSISKDVADSLLCLLISIKLFFIPFLLLIFNLLLFTIIFFIKINFILKFIIILFYNFQFIVYLFLVYLSQPFIYEISNSIIGLILYTNKIT